jgi:hypothetical protein
MNIEVQEQEDIQNNVNIEVNISPSECEFKESH